ncbi:hypothetical protein GLA29479_3625 [Lysobacter antibioticus]|nr:hypothetical protein [Lysobacter antibioticus]ALN64478.1 hypothetical protein GLA29479_3625 [Lysobacter antibioticus]
MELMGRTGPRLRLHAAALATGLMLAAPLAQAQNFETHYGNQPWRDGGEDVKAVNYCPGRGSVTVGTRRSSDGNTQVLVTRANDLGVTDDSSINTWQNAYMIAGSKRSDAFGIVELSGERGFAVTGAVQLGEGSFIYVLQIDCRGRQIWTTLLDNVDTSHRATGYDLIETGSVMPSKAPAQGDLVVVGEENDKDGRTLGRIARLDAVGNVLWDHRYDGSGDWPGLRFRAVTENLASSGGFTDIVVAGTALTTDAKRGGLMFRTDANGAPVCSSVLIDGQDHRDFHGLTALLNANYTGETVSVGASTGLDEGSASQAYLARYDRYSCKPVVQATWVDRDKASFTAFDVVEARGLDGREGAVAVVGTIAGTQGFLFAANTRDLLRYGGLGPRRFGDKFRESLYAIDRKSDRFILAGNTFSDWQGVGDIQDFYFVQVDPGLNTGCADLWDPGAFNPDLPYKEFLPHLERIPKFQRVDTPSQEARDWGYVCAVDPPEGCPGLINNGIIQLGVSPTGYLNIECPNIDQSSGRYGTRLVGLRYMPTNGEASAPGAPCEGWGVANADPAALVTGRTSRCAGTSNVTLVSFTPTPSTATSVVTVGSTFRVTHQYTPIAATSFLYRVDVKIENIGRITVKDLRYTRGIDYDVPPNTFSEYITLAGASPFLLAWNNNGFNSLDPLVANSGLSGPMTDNGPGDLGAHMDFRFGSLAPGAARSFVTYYGAAPTQTAALNALSIVGAGLYSLGQTNWDGIGGAGNTSPNPGTAGAINGVPATFMYGLKTN